MRIIYFNYYDSVVIVFLFGSFPFWRTFCLESIKLSHTEGNLGNFCVKKIYDYLIRFSQKLLY